MVVRVETQITKSFQLISKVQLHVAFLCVTPAKNDYNISNFEITRRFAPLFTSESQNQLRCTQVDPDVYLLKKKKIITHHHIIWVTHCLESSKGEF